MRAEAEPCTRRVNFYRDGEMGMGNARVVNPVARNWKTHYTYTMEVRRENKPQCQKQGASLRDEN